jgi:xanthine dehydrogenase accessory factor
MKNGRISKCSCDEVLGTLDPHSYLPESTISRLRVCIKGAGEMASAVAWRLFTAGIHKIVMVELPAPLAVRRRVSFSEAVYEGCQIVEGVQAVRVDDMDSIDSAWQNDRIAVVVDPEWNYRRRFCPDVVVDAILAKRNLGSTISEAPLVIGLGPGFRAGFDAHFVIETNRGINLGKIVHDGYAEPNTGIPGNIGGVTTERVLRAPANGIFKPRREIGDIVRRGETIGWVAEAKVEALIDGLLKGLIRPGAPVSRGLKIGDIDPRGAAMPCDAISDKARAIAESVLEVIFNTSQIEMPELLTQQFASADL